MKILYLTARQPYPYAKGDQVLAYEQIKELSKRHEVYLVSFYKTDKDTFVEEMSKYCAKVYIVRDSNIIKLVSMLKTVYNLKPLQVNMFLRRGLKKMIFDLYNSIRPDIVHVQTIRMAEYFMNSEINKSIDFIDALSLNMAKRKSVSKGLVKLLWNFEGWLLSKYEKQVLNKYKIKTLVASRDKEYLEDVSVIVNPLGVALSTSNDIHIMEQNEFRKRLNLVFHGNMSYYPNVDAALFLVNKIFPEIKKKYPHSKLYIVGSNPTRDLLKYASDDIIVTGYVKSREDFFAIVDFAIYPVRYATGLQSKVLEAMCFGIPSVISTECAEGIEGITSGQEIMIAQNTEEYLESIEKMIKDDVLRKSLIDKGQNFVKENHSWEKHVAVLEKLWQDGLNI